MLTTTLATQVLLCILGVAVAVVIGPWLLSVVAKHVRDVELVLVGTFATDQDFNPTQSGEKQVFRFQPVYARDCHVAFLVREKDPDGQWGDCDEMFTFDPIFFSRKRVARFYRDLPHHNRTRPADIKATGAEAVVLGRQSISEMDPRFRGRKTPFGRRLEAMRGELRAR